MREINLVRSAKESMNMEMAAMVCKRFLSVLLYNQLFRLASTHYYCLTSITTQWLYWLPPLHNPHPNFLTLYRTEQSSGWNRYSPVLPRTGCVIHVSVCMLECVHVCCYSVCENLLATVRISWSRGARKTHPTSTLWVNTSLRGRTTDWVGVSRRGVKTTMSKFLHTDLVN